MRRVVIRRLLLFVNNFVTKNFPGRILCPKNFANGPAWRKKPTSEHFSPDTGKLRQKVLRRAPRRFGKSCSFVFGIVETCLSFFSGRYSNAATHIFLPFPVLDSSRIVLSLDRSGPRDRNHAPEYSFRSAGRADTGLYALPWQAHLRADHGREPLCHNL